MADEVPAFLPTKGAADGSQPAPPLVDMETDALHVAVDAVSRVASLEVRVGALERNHVTLSGQMEGVEDQGDQNNAAIGQLRESVNTLLASNTELRADVAAVAVTLNGIKESWTPTIAEIKPLLEEKRTDGVIHQRDLKRRDATIRYLGVVATILGMAGGGSSVLTVVSRWPRALVVLEQTPLLVAFVIAMTLFIGAVVWRVVPKGGVR